MAGFSSAILRLENSTPGTSLGINAMVAAPGFQIVLEDLARNFAHDGIPGRAEPLAVADNQVGRIVHIRASVSGVGVKGAGDADRPDAGSTRPLSLLAQFSF